MIEGKTLTLRRILYGFIFLGLAYLLLWPVPIRPVASPFPEAPDFVGDYAANNRLSAATKVTLPDGEIGPEDLAVHPDGTIYTTSLRPHCKWVISGSLD